MSKTKGAGSTKNGRDSQSKRLGREGVRRHGGQRRRRSSSASGAPASTRARTSAAATTTPCSPSPTARSSSASARGASSSTSCPATEPAPPSPMPPPVAGASSRLAAGEGPPSARQSGRWTRTGAWSCDLSATAMSCPLPVSGAGHLDGRRDQDIEVGEGVGDARLDGGGAVVAPPGQDRLLGHRAGQAVGHQGQHQRMELHPQVDLGQAEPAPVGPHHPPVVGQRQHRPDAERVAVERRRRRHREREQPGEQVAASGP